MCTKISVAKRSECDVGDEHGRMAWYSTRAPQGVARVARTFATSSSTAISKKTMKRRHMISHYSSACATWFSKVHDHASIPRTHAALSLIDMLHRKRQRRSAASAKLLEAASNLMRIS
jgi:hypothetical protein